MDKEKAFPKRTSVLELDNEVLMHTVACFSKICFKFSGVELRYKGLEKKNERFLAAKRMVSAWASISGCLYTGTCLKFP